MDDYRRTSDSHQDAVTQSIYIRDATLFAAIMAVLLAFAFAPFLFGGSSLMSASSEASLYDAGATFPEPHAEQRLLDPAAPAAQTEPWLAIDHRLTVGDHFLPFWDPYSAYGTPFAAAMQPQPFYPLTALAALAPSPRTYAWWVVMRLFLAGWFAALFVRLFVDRWSALIAGIATAFGGYYLLFYNMPHLSVEVELPMLLWATELIVRRVTPGRVGALALAAGLSYVGGMPESTLLVLGAAVAYAAFRLLPTWRPTVGAGLVGAHILGAALSAVVLIPLAEFLGTSISSHGSQTGLEVDADPWRRYILTELAPFALGGPISSILPGGGHTGIQGFVGCAALALAAIGLFSLPFAPRRARGVIFALGTFVLYAILKRYGNPIVQWTGMLPFAQLVKFPKYVEAILDPSIAMLAGFGTGYLRTSARRSTPVLLGFAAALAAFTTAYLTVRPEVPGSAAAHFDTFTLLALGTLTLTGLAAFLALRERVGRTLATCVLVATVAAEPFLGYVLPNIWDAPPITWNPYGGAPYLAFLAEHVDRDQERVFGCNYDFFPNWPGAYGFADPRELNALYPSRYLPFVNAFLAQPGSVAVVDRFTGIETGGISRPRVQRWLRLSSVRYVVSPRDQSAPGIVRVFASPDADVYRIDTALPRLRLVHQATRVASFDAALATLRAPEFDVSAEAVIEGTSPTLAPARGPEHVWVTASRSDRIDITLDVTGDALLIQNDSWYPGWVATLDNREVAILRTDGIFRGVAVPAGRHRLTIAYRPNSVRMGMVISAIALLALLALFGWPRRLARSPRGSV